MQDGTTMQGPRSGSDRVARAGIFKHSGQRFAALVWTLLGLMMASGVVYAATFTMPAGSNYFNGHLFSTFAGATGAAVTTGQLSPQYTFTATQVGTGSGTGVVQQFAPGFLPAGSGYPSPASRMGEMSPGTGLTVGGRIRYTFSQALPTGTHVYMQDIDSSETATLQFYTCTGVLINPSGFDYLIAATSFAPTAVFGPASVTLTNTTGAANQNEPLVAVIIRSSTVCRVEYTGTFGGGTFETYFSLPPTDVGITKSLATPNPVAPGGPVSWTLTTTNNALTSGIAGLSNPMSASGVVISDTVTSSVTGVSAVVTSAGGTTGGSCTVGAGNAVTCSGFTPLAVGQSIVVTISGTLSAQYAGPNLVNTATVTNTVPNDRVPSNNTSTSTTPVIPLPRLTVRKISLGGVGSFDFTGSNGVATQTLATTTAGTPVAGTTQSLTAAGAATTITESALPATYLLTAITCTGLGAGGTATPDLANRTVALNAAATAAGTTIVCTFTNTLQQADLQVVKTASPTTVVSGDVVTYTLVASNNGPVGATNVILADAPSAGQTCTTPSATATCTATGGASCPSATVPVTTLLGSGITLPTLPVGGQVTVALQCTVTASGQ